MPKGFGQLARRLREERGLTQGELAARVGVHMATIQRGESEERPKLRRSTVSDWLSALHRAAPVPREDAEALLTAAGVSLVLLQRVRAAEGAPPAQPLPSRVELLVGELLGLVGEAELVRVLGTLAAAWSPRGEAAPASPVRSLRRDERVDGVDYTLISPVARPEPPARQPGRRTGS